MIIPFNLLQCPLVKFTYKKRSGGKKECSGWELRDSLYCTPKNATITNQEISLDLRKREHFP
jgi:hypothetical protein